MRQDRQFSRREFLWMTAGATAAYFGIRTIATNQETEGLLKGGEIISEKDLIILYDHLCKDQVPFSINPTIVKSTIFHACRFYGMSEDLSRQRSNGVISPEKSAANPICPITAAACVTVAKGNGQLLTEIKEVGGIMWNSPDEQWLDLCEVLSHEAYHMNAEKVETSTKREDYGVLGTYDLKETRYGFYAREETYIGPTNTGPLTRRNIAIPIDGKLTPTSLNVVEEFSAELARIHFIKHLAKNGVTQFNLFDLNYTPQGFSFMRQGLIDIQHTFTDGSSWLTWWDGVLDFQNVSSLHRSGNRYQLFLNAGEVIKRKNNKIEKSLTNAANTAAIGFVAVTDFMDKTISGGKILESLATKPQTAQDLINHASYMRKKQETVTVTTSP